MKKQYDINFDTKLLHEITNDCNLDAIKELLQKGASLNPMFYGQNIENIIVHLFQSNNKVNTENLIKTIDFFINKGVSINPDGWDQPLNLAINKGNIEVVKFLLEKGAFVDGKSGQQNPLETALYKQEAEIVKLLINHGAKVNPIGENIFTTPLIAACESGNFEFFKLLIEKGAEINPTGESLKFSPLISAIRSGNNKIIQSLLEDKAEINPTGPKLISTPLIEACMLGDLSLIKKFIDNGADVNTVKYCPMPITALGKVITNGNKEVIKFLLENGANPNLICNDLILTPLGDACQMGDVELVKLLIEYNAEINPKNIDILLSPLIQSISSGNINLVKYLISQGANYKTSSANLILNAMNSNNEDMFDYLTKELGISLYPLPDSIQEYIFTAIQNCHERIKWVQKLIDLGANLDIKNIQGKTVMALAYEIDDSELINLLENNEVQKDLNLHYMPSWIHEYNQISQYIPGLYPEGEGVSNNPKFNNPNRFKKIFETKEEKEEFLKKLELKFDQFIKEYSVRKLEQELEDVHEIYINQIENLRLKKFDAQNAYELINQHYKTNDVNEKKEVLTKSCILLEKIRSIETQIENIEKNILINSNQKTSNTQLELNVQNVINIAKKVKEKALNKDSLLYNVIKTTEPQEVLKITANNNVKVFVIDGFLNNEKLNNSTFNHPKLNDKLSQEALNKQLEARDHATHVCGIISDSSNGNVVFDMENLNKYNENTNLNNAKIVNMSVGNEFLSYTKMFDFFLQNQGKCIFVKALGNEATTMVDSMWLNQLIKHEVLKKHVIFVGNVMSDGETLSPSSNIPGDNKIIQEMSVVAPGTNIDSYIPIVDEEKFKTLCPNMEYNTEGHANKTGTSMAAPFVTGLAATILGKYPNLALDKVVEFIKAGCTKIGESNLFGHGVINFEASIDLATDYIIQQNCLLGEDWFLQLD